VNPSRWVRAPRRRRQAALAVIAAALCAAAPVAPAQASKLVLSLSNGTMLTWPCSPYNRFTIESNVEGAAYFETVGQPFCGVAEIRAGLTEQDCQEAPAFPGHTVTYRVREATEKAMSNPVTITWRKRPRRPRGAATRGSHAAKSASAPQL
jgi:hypothetical protein